MYQNCYLHASPSRFSAKSAIYTAAGCRHKIAIYTAAVTEQIQIYTRLPCVKSFKSLIAYIHCCRVYTQNRYLHGSLSRAKLSIYIADGCIHKRLFTWQPFKSQIVYIHCCRVYTLNCYLHDSDSRANSAMHIAAGCIHKYLIYTAVKSQIGIYIAAG